MSSVFVSYNSADAEYVERLVQYLEAAGFSCWFYRMEPSGVRFDQVITEEINKCAAVAVVMTPESRASIWVANECAYARMRHKPVLPMLLSGEPFAELASRSYEDVRGGMMPGGQFMAAIADAVRSTRAAGDGVGQPLPPLITTRMGRPYREPTPLWVTVILAILGIAFGAAALMLWQLSISVWVLLGCGGLGIACGIGAVVMRSDAIRLLGQLAGFAAAGTLLVALVDRIFIDDRPAGWWPPILSVLAILTLLNAIGGFVGLTEKSILLDRR